MSSPRRVDANRANARRSTGPRTTQGKARVAFGRDWRADAERRDFTINALSASADGLVYDYVGGLADIAFQALDLLFRDRAVIRPL